MIKDVIWIVALVVLLVSIVIQYRALNRIAFSRSLFISGIAFFTAFVIHLFAPPNAGFGAWVLFLLFLAAGWLFLLFMTYQSWRRLRSLKK